MSAIKKKLTLLDYPSTTVAAYAALDAYATYGLAEKFYDRTSQTDKYIHTGKLLVDDDEVCLHYDRIDSLMLPILYRMERRGIRVDREKLHTKRKEIEPKLVKLEKAILKEAKTAFNMRSPKQVTAVFAARGIVLKSTDEKNLKAIAHKDKLANLMLEHRENSKIISTYLDSLEELLDDNDRIHTSFNLHIADTGRLSSSNPNV